MEKNILLKMIEINYKNYETNYVDKMKIKMKKLVKNIKNRIKI